MLWKCGQKNIDIKVLTDLVYTMLYTKFDTSAGFWADRSRVAQARR
jgi:hypothetical protein